MSTKDVKFEPLMQGRALYTEADRIWIAQGMTFFAVDFHGKRVSRKYRVGGGKAHLMSLLRLSRQLLRQGIHHLVPLGNGDLFVVAKRCAYTVGADGNVKHEFRGFRGNKPGHQGVCVTPEGTLFFGEYTLNQNRDHDTVLYRSTNGGATFEAVLTLPMKEYRHIHFVKHDPYENCLWLGTGDEDFECKLMRSDDNGTTWETVGQGSQDWRAIGVCFDESSLTWGTDAGSVPDQNHIIRMDRKTKVIEILADAEGPCHGCASFSDGRVFISTGVEGGENEKDRFARLKRLDGKGMTELLKRKKDVMPLILQYGVIRFPLGTERTDRAVFTMMGLRGGGEKIYVEQSIGK